MSFSLLHVPKSDVPAVVKEIHRVLMPNGIFYISLFEGEGEGFREDDRAQYGCARYFAYYHLEELEELVIPHFKATKTARLDISPRPTISFKSIKC